MSLNQLKAFVKEIEKNEQTSHGYRAESSFSMLHLVDLMIDKYLIADEKDHGAILLDIFGVLQGLFVAIDALYDLAIGLTKFKYHINVNSNKALHELKYIRNDIVGHPTNRTYPNGGTGFSILSTTNLSREKISYHTYIFEKNNMEIKTKDVYLKPLFDAYFIERDLIIKDIFNYLTHQDTKTHIPEDVYSVYETLNLEKLKEIRNQFMLEYNLNENSSHRFLWRVDLLTKLISWEENDPELNDFILYMCKIQVSKLYDISLDMEKRIGKDLYTPIPKILESFYRFIRKDEAKLYPLLTNLHDYTHPLYNSDLNGLIGFSRSSSVTKILEFLKNQTDDQKAYLIGSTLRSYRLKK
jgi:hypothetical protein